MFVCFASLVVDAKKQTVRRREILELFAVFIVIWYSNTNHYFDKANQQVLIRNKLLHGMASVHAKLESRNAQTTGSVSFDDLTQCMLENNAYSLVSFTRA